MPKTLGEDIFNRITKEMNIWGENLGEDAEAQWASMDLDFDCVQSLLGLIMEECLGSGAPPVLQQMVAPGLAYAFAFGVRLGREQT